MSFITTTRLFGKPVKAGQKGGYLFDLLFFVFLWMSYLGANDLRGFGSGSPNVTVPAATFVFFGALGIYGIRIAMYIAMFRHNRAPQVAEWLAFIVPLCLAVPCFVASGHLVKFYASAHGYRFCYQDGTRAPRYTFALPSAACPKPPPANDND